jgi:hypothetical protein
MALIYLKSSSDKVLNDVGLELEPHHVLCLTGRSGWPVNGGRE